MSPLMRIGALGFLGMVLFGDSPELRADSYCEFECINVVVAGNEAQMDCLQMSCYDAWVCTELENGCLLLDCDEREAGSHIHIRC